MLRTLLFATVLAACGSQAATPRPNVVEVGKVPTQGGGQEVAPREISCRVDAELARLSKPLTIDAFLPGGAAEAFSGEVSRRLERYRAASKIEVRVVDTSTDAGREKARNADLTEFELDEGKPGFSGLVITYGGTKSSLRSLSPRLMASLDYVIVNKLREVRETAEGSRHEIGVLIGHGERTLADPSLLPGNAASLESIASQHFPMFRFSNIDLRDGAADVPASVEGLLVLAPQRDLAKAELARIDAFVARGKSLVVFESATQGADPTGPRHAPKLGGLLKSYGIDVHDDLVVDNGNAFTATIPIVPEPALDRTFLPFFGIEEAAFPLPSSVSVTPSRQPNARVRIVAQSSAHVGLAAAATGRFRVAVFASSLFLANPFVNDAAQVATAMAYTQATATSSILVFKNTLDWMVVPDELAACIK